MVKIIEVLVYCTRVPVTNILRYFSTPSPTVCIIIYSTWLLRLLSGPGRGSSAWGFCNSHWYNHEELAWAWYTYTGLGIRSSVFRANRSFFVSKRAICWRSLFCKERRERFAHGCSFLKSDESKSLPSLFKKERLSEEWQDRFALRHKKERLVFICEWIFYDFSQLLSFNQHSWNFYFILSQTILEI